MQKWEKFDHVELVSCHLKGTMKKNDFSWGYEQNPTVGVRERKWCIHEDKISILSMCRKCNQSPTLTEEGEEIMDVQGER